MKNHQSPYTLHVIAAQVRFQIIMHWVDLIRFLRCFYVHLSGCLVASLRRDHSRPYRWEANLTPSTTLLKPEYWLMACEMLRGSVLGFVWPKQWGRKMWLDPRGRREREWKKLGEEDGGSASSEGLWRSQHILGAEKSISFCSQNVPCVLLTHIF